MPWCFDCRTEYPEGTARCVLCGDRLCDGPVDEPFLAAEDEQVRRRERRRRGMLRVLGFVMAVVFFCYAILRSFVVAGI